MPVIALPPIGTVAAWRTAARKLAAQGVAAEQAIWHIGDAPPDLFAADSIASGQSRTLHLSRAAIDDIERALCHSDPERFARAYGLILRLSEGSLTWGDRRDPAMRTVLAQAKAVRRDSHKMHAFVRFREVDSSGPRRRFAAWFEPDHPIVECATPFFAKRFGDMDWVIATPTLTATFTDGALSYAKTTDRPPAPDDSAEDLWRTYYASIFNAARLMPRAMQSEMPRKYWHNLPEADLIPGLIRGAECRVADMAARAASDPPVRRAAIARAMAMPERAAPTPGSLAELGAQAAACTRCPLHAPATQVVMGEGPKGARLMIVGEQPGDIEDLTGRPFAGPAGHLFDKVAAAAGLDRSAAYVTNAVKHFKFVPRGKRRLHQRPETPEIEACKWWLGAERAVVRPRLILAMGATALASLTGTGEGVLKRRGTVETLGDGTPLFVTVHPSYILRLPDPDQKAAMLNLFEQDLRAVARRLNALA